MMLDLVKTKDSKRAELEVNQEESSEENIIKSDFARHKCDDPNSRSSESSPCCLQERK